MTSIDTRIGNIINKLEQLRITNQRTEQRINELEAQAQHLYSVQATQGQVPSRHWTGHKDKHKRKIYIGDKVKFLTSGKYLSTEGVVSGYTKYRVTAIDSKKNEIPREPHNLLIIN